MPEKEDFIIVEGLTKDFNGELVLQDINFKVKEGGSLGILGKSGAGKTVPCPWNDAHPGGCACLFCGGYH